MTANIFDSHKYAKRLVEAGVPVQAADIQAETMIEVMNQVSAGSSKVETQDGKIEHTDARLERMDAKIDMVEARLETKIADAKAELVRWVVGVGMLQMALISALLLKQVH